MSSKDTKVLKFNQYRKSDKTPSTIYVDLESLTKRIDGCKNNFKKLFTAKLGKHISCRQDILMLNGKKITTWTFDGIQNMRDVYRREDCVKKFGESLREHTMKIIRFEKKKMIPLTNKQYESYLNQTNCHICKNHFEDK